MSTIILIIALAIYLIFYFTLGKGMEKKLLKSQEAPAAPSERINDGVDYVPTNKFVLFGHHFASIAGAGPIVGPAMAIAWGWVPALAWIWFGNILIGAIHDYLSLTASVRYDGRSVQFVAQDLIGKKAGKAFGWFILFLCILVVAAFANIVAGQFTANGSVASTFLLFIVVAIITGLLMYRTKMPFIVSTLIGIVLLVGAFTLGYFFGIPLPQWAWYIIILVYIVFASALPVNLLLQPRDYLNSYLLYFGLLVGGVAAIISLRGISPELPVANFMANTVGGQPSPFWPTVPLVIACGALSGFHSLVSSGTSSKQLKREKDALFVGYGGMLVEGFLSTVVIVSIGVFGVMAFGSGEGVLKAAALTRFTQSYGVMVNSALPFLSADFMAMFAGIWVSSFALTTLDTTNRLGRYIISELALPLKNKSEGAYKFFSNKWIASAIIAIIGVALAWSGQYNVLWPAFSGANQLVASVVMMTMAIWVKKRLNPKFATPILIPTILLWITVTLALIWFEIVIIPTYFGITVSLFPFAIQPIAEFKFEVMKAITGSAVGLITLIMLILNFVIAGAFLKRYNKPYPYNEEKLSKATP